MKPIERIDWSVMKRNLHEQGWEKFIENYNLLIERVNELTVSLELDEREAIDDPGLN